MPAPPDAPPEAPRNSWLASMTAVLVPLVAGAAGAAVPVLLTLSQSPTTAESAAQPVETSIVPFGELVANLSEGRMNRYLRLKFSLLVLKPAEKECSQRLQVEGPRLRNWLLSHLSDKSLEEIRGKAGQNQLRREILERFNQVLEDQSRELVLDILFEEFNVQ